MVAAFTTKREPPLMPKPVLNPPNPPSQRRERPAPLPNALAFRIDEVRHMGGPSRTKLYELAAEGKLRLIRVAGRTLVHGDSLRALLNSGCE